MDTNKTINVTLEKTNIEKFLLENIGHNNSKLTNLLIEHITKEIDEKFGKKDRHFWRNNC